MVSFQRLKILINVQNYVIYQTLPGTLPLACPRRSRKLGNGLMTIFPCSLVTSRKLYIDNFLKSTLTSATADTPNCDSM